MSTPENTENLMNAQPQAEHRWLDQLVGHWTFHTRCAGGPDQEDQVFEGTETVRSLGGLWVLAEGQSPMPGGGTAHMITTLGYDPQKRRYIGTWVGSMMNHLWVYDGELDASGRVLTLHAQGPACDPSGQFTGKSAQFKDVIAIQNENERTLTGHLLGEDGQWQPLMQATYRRQPA